MCCKHANIFKLSWVLIFCTVGRVRNIISRFLFNLLYTITEKIFKKYKILCYVLHILDLLMVQVLFFCGYIGILIIRMIYFRLFCMIYICKIKSLISYLCIVSLLYLPQTRFPSVLGTFVNIYSFQIL